MTLPNLKDREFQKFGVDKNGKTVVRTISEIDGTIEANYSPSGLFKEGKVTVVTVNNVDWTALPAAALNDRNAISIQNESDKDIKVNYDVNVSGYVGITVKSGYERYYDIKGSIVVYAKTESGTATITVEELA